MRTFLIFCVLLSFSQSEARAAAFCTAPPGAQPECIYDDAQACRLRAQSFTSSCTPNPRDIAIPTGAGPYCVITSERAVLCQYADRTSCEHEAAGYKGICYDNKQILAPFPEPQRAP